MSLDSARHAKPREHDVGRHRSEVLRRASGLTHLVGHTPLLGIHCLLDGARHTVWAKHETANFTGSVKDRMALHMLTRAHERGDIEPGDEIAEASSGNTGISFAAVGRAMGHPVRIFMPDWMSVERTSVMTALGATVEPISHAQGGFLGAIAAADAYAASRPGVWRPQQFSSADNAEAHERGTGPELLSQLRSVGRTPSGFVAGVGTGGTVTGVGACFTEALADVAIHPLEPANSPTLRTGKRVGSHRIQGISDEFVPALVDLSVLDEVIDAWDGDAILMAQRLASELGLAVGISSGANLIGALSVAAAQGRGSVLATVFADSHKKYLSTDLVKTEPVLEHYLSPRIELLGLDVLPAV
ncbi:MAG: cysteine synthase [Planctomycetota bacterium]|nr:MAG: cysteine synthase [Planctomycetota bacterium]